MATLISFITFFLFLLFFLPHITASKCPPITCDSQSPSIRFPFRLGNQQQLDCGYLGFDLLCNDQNQTILTLPFSGEDFVVQNINYKEQTLTIESPERCIDELGNYLNLRDSPFTFLTGFDDVDHGVIHLSWDQPDCHSCEAGGLRCESRNSTSSLVQCSSSSHSGLSGSAKYGIMMGVGIPGILCTLGIGLYVCDRFGRLRDGLQRRQSIPELTTAVDEQVRPPSVMAGLDSRTIESYVKIKLDESLELPEPDDKTCSICLCEYQPKEIIRVIPDCNHYFHAGCIYLWLRKNPTCPLCRNPPHLAC